MIRNVNLKAGFRVSKSLMGDYFRTERAALIHKLVPRWSKQLTRFIHDLDNLPHQLDYLYKGTDLDTQVSDSSGQSIVPSDKFNQDNCFVSPMPYIALDMELDYCRDIIGILNKIRKFNGGNSRVVVTSYSRLWHPLIKLCEFLGLKPKSEVESNYLSTSNLDELAQLSGFELLHRTYNLLIPIWIPLFSQFVNRFIAPLPFFRGFCPLIISIYKPLTNNIVSDASVSIVIAAKNEEKNVIPLLSKISRLATTQEVIVVEGNSTDDTWLSLKTALLTFNPEMNLKIAKQDGRGKANAIQRAISMSQNDIIIILDADISVDPKELIHFYQILAYKRADFCNGTRFVYPVEDGAMRFLNLVGNKFFTIILTFLLGQRVTDTLCGTKAFWRTDYEKIQENASLLGVTDPFGDFELLFGALSLHLKICNIPVNYKARLYGVTNISRFKDGLKLLRFVRESSLKSRFI